MKTAIFCALENGFKISCEDAKCTQGIAFVHTDLFQEYSIKEECIFIKINLSILIECLNIFGSATAGMPTALKICYKGYGHPLSLLLVNFSYILVFKFVIRTETFLKCQDLKKTESLQSVVCEQWKRTLL
jgi:hypothetical protein